MDFKTLLTELLERIDGSIAGFFCGMDGIGVENVVYARGIDAAPTEVELTTVLKTVNDVAINLKTGFVSRIMLETEKMNIVIEQFSDDYFLCVILKPDGNVGRGRIELKKISSELRKEL
jgi:predicted regulator of Ras-like GTPase activity (Roadblock/LC7/MglB family)